jgi:hypothetical protein
MLALAIALLSTAAPSFSTGVSRSVPQYAPIGVLTAAVMTTSLITESPSLTPEILIRFDGLNKS